MRLNRIIVLFFLVALCVPGIGFSQQWKKATTVAEAYASYPGRIEALFQTMDLDRPGLEKVKAAVASRKFVDAGDALLAFYRDGNTASHLRSHQAEVSDRTVSIADSIVSDIFTFYDLTDRVPRRADGRLDWAHDGPDDDIEWAWGLNRHSHLSTLLNSYMKTGNAVYAKRIDSDVQDWVVSSLPYPGVKSGTAMWRGLEVALRAKVWVRLFYALQQSEHFSPATRILMLSSIPEHTHYMRNFHAKEGNWLTMEMSGLAMVATAWPEFRHSREWVSYAKTNMLEGLKDQVYPDGVQKELTAHYHLVALYNFKQFKDICDEAKEPLPDEYNRELEKMNGYTAYTMTPAGRGILNNDSDNRNNREVITAAAKAYGREDWLFIASNGKAGQRPKGSPSVVFPWAGQLIMRSDYDADAHWGFFDMGPWGTGHQHDDKLHLSITAYGRDLLVDGGRFAYRGELARKFRRYATGSESHNLVMIDGKGQEAGPRVAEQPLDEKQYKVTDQFDYATGSFDRFRDISGTAQHHRSVLYVRGKFWVVVDKVQTDRPRKVETLWHWHPDVTLQKTTNGVTSTDHEKGNLSIIPVDHEWKVSEVKGAENPPQGWYSDRYNKAEPAPVSIYSSDIQRTTTFVWILQPSEKRMEPLKARIDLSNDNGVIVVVTDDKSNEWKINVPFGNASEAGYVYSPSNNKKVTGSLLHNTEGAKALLSRLDLSRPGLESVRARADDPQKSIEALLSYYRSRTSVKHPVDRSQLEASRGKIARERDLEHAENALKHVFIGQGAYPPYYCGNDINWGFRPVPDNEWVWQLNRMGFWDALGRAYWHTGDEKYAREWALQLLDWTQKNPRDEQHAYAWRSIEAGIRGYRWTGLFQRFIDSPSFTPDVLVAFLNSCYDHAAYLMTKYRKGSNWGLMEAEGMAFIAMVFPEFLESEEWRTEGIARLNAEIDNQVYPDGHQRELAMGYHTGSIGWFQRTLDLATMNGLKNVFSDKYLTTIERMCEVPFKLGMPDGTTPQFGDSWQGAPGHIWPDLLQWADLFGREDFRYVATQGKEGKKPFATAFALEKSGLYSMRSDWNQDAVCLVLKCGPNGGGHCQPDNGTFELYAGGRNLMPDAGSYIYSGNPEGRAWFRQTKIHQTLTLNGENTAYAPKQLLWQPGANHDILVVENESYPGLTHRRSVIFVDKQYFVVIDEAIGNANGAVDIHFQIAPGGAIVDSTGFSVRSNFPDGWNVLVQTRPQRGLTFAQEEGWVSFVYTKKEPRPAFRFGVDKQSAEGVRFVTIVVPYQGTAAPKVSAELVGNPAVGASKIELRVTNGKHKRKIRYDLTPRQKT